MKNKAIITSLNAGIYKLVDKNTNVEYQAYAKGFFRYQKVDEKSEFNINITNKNKKDIKILKISPKVGDIVEYEISNDKCFIVKIYPRKNEILRPDVSNVDNAILIFSAKEPDISFMLLDKMILLCYIENIKPFLVITKKDLDSNLNILKDKLNYYNKYLNIDIYYVNNLKEFDNSFLDSIIKDKITILAGQSGVGKSSFINNIYPMINIKTQEISKALGRGKHTTRNADLYYIKGGYIADTPGFSSISIPLKSEKELINYYPDFIELSRDCKFGYKCFHILEPNCNVSNNLDILKSRYINYTKLYDEIKSRKKIY